MTKKKKAAKKREEYNRTSHDSPTAKEVSEAIKRLEAVATGKKNGAIIVLEQFEDNGRKGIMGLTYWNGMDIKSRALTIAEVAGMPVPLLLALLMASGEASHKHDEKGNCI